MKTRNILAFLLLLVAGVQTALAQKMVVTLSDESKVRYSISQVKDITFEETEDREYVDLGLPSGTLWATCNIGASKPEEYGDHFAWGETQPKSEYNWGTYKWCKGSEDTMTKYCTKSEYGYNGFADGKTELEAADDAATANWGSDWQMPSFEQFKELINNDYTTMEWMTQGKVPGWRITSIVNGNTLFLPAAGYSYDTTLKSAGTLGGCWGRRMGGESTATCLTFSSGYIRYNAAPYRFRGYSVRPVRKQ